MLLVILLLGGAARFWQLAHRGLLLYDEGFLQAEASTVHAFLTGMRPDGLPAQLPFLTPVRSGRLVHELMFAGALAVRPDAAAGPALSAAAGMVSIALVWLLAARLRDRTTAALAATLLALSPFAVAYDRSGLSDGLATMWSLAALTALVHALPAPGGRRPVGLRAVGWLALAGLCGAFAFLTSNRYLPSILLLPVCAWLGGVRRRPIVPAAAVIVGVAAPFLLGELLERHWARVWGRSVLSAGPLFSQLGGFYAFHGGTKFSWQGAHALFAYLLSSDGWISTAWAVAACAWLALDRRRDRREWAVHLWWIAPVLLWSVYWTKCHRFYCHAMPFLALLKADGLLAAARRLRRSARAALAVGAMLAASSLPALREEIAWRSPYAAALDRLIQPPPLHVTTDPWLGNALAGFGRSQLVPTTDAGLEELKAIGYRVLVTDLQLWYGGFPDTDKRIDILAAIARARRPAAVIPYPPRALSFFVFNQALPWDIVHRAVPAMDGSGPAPAVRVYVLSGPREDSLRP